MGRSIFRSVFIALYLLVCLLFFIVISVLLVVGVKRKDYFESNRLFKEYKFILRNHESDETFSGITTQSEIISENGFEYVEEDNYSILVTEFGSTEYECEGMCYCENPNILDRRGGIESTMGRFSVLVGAVSSVLALQYAKEYFGSTCEDELRGECSMNAVKSKVDSCEKIGYPHRKKELREYGEFFEEFEEGTSIFWCKGNCMANVYNQEIKYPVGYMDLKKGKNFDGEIGTEREKQLALAYGCEEHKLETEIWIDVGQGGWDGVDKEDEAELEQEARQEFIHEFLEPFCLEQKSIEGSTILCGHDDWMELDCFKGKRKVDIPTEDIEKMCLEDCDKGIRSKFPLCVAHDSAIHITRGVEESENESVVCRKMVDRTERYRNQVLEEKKTPKGKKKYQKKKRHVNKRY